MGSREFWEAPAKGMMSQRDIDAVMSLQNDEVLTLLDVLDQASRLVITQASYFIARV